MTVDLATQTERIESLRESMGELRSARQRLEDKSTDFTAQLAVLKQGLEELKRQHDELDRRRWSVWLLFVGSLLTLIGNLLLFALRVK